MAREKAQFIIPESLKFIQPKKGPCGERKLFRNNAVNSTYSTSGDKIVRFYFPNSKVVDFRRGAIAFNLSVTNLSPGTTYCRVANGVWSIFNRVRLTTGMELEDIREYNFIHSFIWNTMKDPTAGDQSGEVFGWGTKFERNAWTFNNPKNYEMPLLIGFFQTGVVPLSLFQEQLQLELYLEDPTRCIETDSTTTPIITLSQIYFHYEVLQLPQGVESSIKMMARAAGVCYPFRTFTFYTTPVTSATSNLIIPHASTAIDTFISLFRNYGTLNNMTIDDKFYTWNRYNIYNHQLKLNNEFFPYEPVQSDVHPQSYHEFLRWLGKWKLTGHYGRPASVDYDSYQNDKFVIIKAVDTFPGEGLVNDVSTDMSGSYVYMMIWMNTPPPANINMDTFVQHFRCIKFDDRKLTLV
jgi:hypothetical protein